VEESKGEIGSILTATVVVSGYRSRLDPPEIVRCATKAAKTLRSMTPATLYSCETLLKRSPPDLQDMAAALGQFIQEAHAVVGQRYFAGHRDVAAADQPRIRDGLVKGATRAGRDQGRAGAGAAGHAGEARGREGLARVVAGRRVVKRRASIDFPTPGGPRSSTLWSERLHQLQLHRSR
jgi:hypothetical protein